MLLTPQFHLKPEILVWQKILLEFDATKIFATKEVEFSGWVAVLTLFCLLILEYSGNKFAIVFYSSS